MNLAEFRDYRDRFALSSMLARGRVLEAESKAAWADINRLRKERAQYHVAPGLQYALTKEQFDDRIRTINIIEKLETELDMAWRKWSLIEIEIGDILRDHRYIEWAESQQQEAS